MFRPIDLSDRYWYEKFYTNFPPYADFSFGNLMIWLNQYNDLQLSQLNGNVILRCTNSYMDDRMMFNILGVNLIDETIHAIFAYQNANGLKKELLGVPHFIIEQVKNPELYHAIEDPDNAEYILDTHLLGYLQGSFVKKMRQYVNGFEQHAGKPIAIERFDLSDPTCVNYLRHNLTQWEKAFSTNETAAQEIPAFNTALRLSDQLSYTGIGLKVGEDLAGFLLYQSIPRQDTVIVNHLKTSYRYWHTSLYLTHHLARLLSDEGIDFMNFEQDLGIQGLRAFKLKLRPHHMLKKYNITPAT